MELNDEGGIWKFDNHRTYQTQKGQGHAAGCLHEKLMCMAEREVGDIFKGQSVLRAAHDRKLRKSWPPMPWSI